MGIRLIYGEPGTGKSEFCFSEIAKQIGNEEKIYMITPEQFSFTAEKKLMDAISSKAVLNAEVLTLSRMAYRVLNEIGGLKNNISKSGKAMLIYSILNDYKKDLKFLSKNDENIELCIDAIKEFKKHGITVDMLQDEIDKLDDNYLKYKLNDMNIVFQKFEERINNNYIDETDLLTYLAENIDKTDIIKNSIIYLDEFSGFTNQEYNIITKFLENAKQVNITITTDELESNKDPNVDIYYSNKITVSKIMEIVEKNNFEKEESVCLKNQYRFKTDELKFLAKNMNNNKFKNYEKEPCNIELFLAKNPYSEVEEIAKKIALLIKKGDLRYKDISIIAKNIDDYSSLVRVIFRKYEIPIFIDEKRDLNQNIVIQYILSIIEIINKNFSQDSVFNYLKTGFSDIDKEEIYKLENYCIKWDIKQNKFKKDFIYEMDNENKKQEIQRLNELRIKIVNPLLDLRNKINEKRTVKNISKCLYEFVISQNIQEKMKNKMEELENNGLIELAQEYSFSYKIIISLLDEMVSIFDEEKISIDKYYKILKIGLGNSELSKIPATQDQVIFGDIDRSRTHKVKNVFILGLNDGIFPSVNNNEGFFDDKDREELKEDGIELAKGTIDRLYEDNFNIYKAFTTAEEKLFLSYSSTDRESKTLRPSILIHKIKKIFPNIKEKSDIVEKDIDDYEDYNNTIYINEKSLYEELLKNIYKLKEGEKILPLWYEIFNYYKQKDEWYKKLNSDLLGLKYTNLPEKIKSENVEKLYENNLVTSISRLEKYRSCPFSYYLKYGLNLKEKEKLQVHSFDTGTFMHEIIDEFFKSVKDEGYHLTDLNEDENEIFKIVSNIVEEKLSLNKYYIFTATIKYKVLVNRLKKIISKALKYIIQTLIYSEFDIKGTEVEFGKNGDYKPITFNLDNGKTVSIIGKIDRIDTAKGEDGKYLRIIDYKSSVKNIDLNEVYAGLQIQLLTYTDAICKEEDFIPAGIFYFSLLEQMVSADKKQSKEEIEELIRKNFRMKGLILADVKVIKMNDINLKSGSSKLVPAAITTSGTVNEKWTNGVNKEEFKILQDYIGVIIKKISKEILSGNIDLKPYNNKGKTPCKYCEYRTICGFNPSQEGNSYYYIDNKSKDEIISKMKQDI